MESKPCQSLGQIFLLLLLQSLLFGHIHCMNVSLDSVPLVVLKQQVGKSGSCIQKIDFHITDIRERQEDFCGKEIFYPVVKTVGQNQKICFTDTRQNYFDIKEYRINYTNVTGCEILRQEKINHVNISCNLRRGYQKLDKDQMFMSVLLRCNNETKQQQHQQQQHLCLIIATVSRNLSRVDGDSCLSALKPSSNFTEKSTTHPAEKTSSEGNSFLDYMKEYMIPVLATLGSVLFLIIIVVANRVRKECIRNRNESSEAGVSNTSEGGIYHEPNNPTFMDIEENNPRNYEYAYGHLNPDSSSGSRQEHGKKHNYMNIAELPDKRKDDEEYYINIDKDDMEYMEMKNSYQSLDRSSMVNDDAMYQGLIEKKGRVRPKVAPKPSHLGQVEESPELSYVKVL